MKTLYRIISIICFTVICSSAFAQDVITLKNGDEIEVKVLEVGITEIKYKKFDNQSGPTYTKNVSDIFMIKYQNGERDLFQSKVQSQPQVRQEKNSSVAPLPKNQVTRLRLEDRGWSDGEGLRKQIYMNGQLLKKKEIRNLYQISPDVLSLYESGRKSHNVATAFAIAGVVTFCSTTGFLIGYLVDPDYKTEYLTLTLVSGGISLSCFTLDFVFIGKGNSKIAKSVELYNEYRVQPVYNQRAIKLDFGVTSSGGIGLCMTF